jgi:hypothetical protein
MLITALVCLLISVDVKASPSQTLVVENNTNATITVSATVSSPGGHAEIAQIPPQSEVTLNDFLPVGSAYVAFDPECVEPVVDAVQNTYVVNQGGTKIKRKYLYPSHFGKRNIFDRPGCGFGYKCEKAIGTWKWDRFGTVVIEQEKTRHVDTGNTGKWRCMDDGKTVLIDWTIRGEPSPVRDTLRLSDNGSRLIGKNNKKPPTSINATKHLGK